MKILVADDQITEDVFVRTAKKAGILDGFGRWNPAHGGSNGRFAVESVKWTKTAE